MGSGYKRLQSNTWEVLLQNIFNLFHIQDWSKNMHKSSRNQRAHIISVLIRPVRAFQKVHAWYQKYWYLLKRAQYLELYHTYHFVHYFLNLQDKILIINSFEHLNK